jgi:hypothetical protein|tara:strand:+ start:1330 stop:2619 length:1290 start_codon:yes stop_codon:yes gene_type:complete
LTIGKKSDIIHALQEKNMAKPTAKSILIDALNAVIRNKGNKAAASRDLGIPRTTLLERIEQAQLQGIKPTMVPPDAEAALIEQQYSHDAEMRDMKRQVDVLAKENLSHQKLKNSLIKAENHTIKPPKWISKNTPAKGAPGVPTIFLSDFHWGEVVDKQAVNGINEYDREIALRRFKNVINTTIDLCTNHMVNPKYPGIICALGGDMISGDIHDELAENNDGTNIEHVLDLLDNMTWALEKFAKVFGRVFVPCTFGNHSRTYKQYRHKQAAKTNYDWMLYNLLARHFKNDKRIQFQIPTGFDTVYKVYGVSYLLTHGDRLGVAGGTGIVGMLGPIARGVQKIKQEYNNQNKTIDYVILGHYHQYISLKGCIVNGSTKGYDEYAYSNRFTSERPQQALWFTHPEYGVTFQVPVVVDEPTGAKSKDWVSWMC